MEKDGVKVQDKVKSHLHRGNCKAMHRYNWSQTSIDAATKGTSFPFKHILVSQFPNECTYPFAGTEFQLLFPSPTNFSPKVFHSGLRPQEPAHHHGARPATSRENFQTPYFWGNGHAALLLDPSVVHCCTIFHLRSGLWNIDDQYRYPKDNTEII